MRACMFALAALAGMAASTANGHGPQIQITIDNDKIVTRRLIHDAPYSSTLTAASSVYVMPLLPFDNVWYTRPNNDVDPIFHELEFFSGPGVAYGYDQVDGGPQAFAEGSVLSVNFTDGLQLWNGASFEDAGDTQVKAFRGSNVNIASPPENLAITSDMGPFDSVSINPVLENYGTEGTDVHNTIRFALLGDGTSPTSASPDGVYLLSLQITSTQIGLEPSEEYYFVMHKHATDEAIAAAVGSLTIDASLIQYVPEPSAVALALVGMSALLGQRRRAARRHVA